VHGALSAGARARGSVSVYMAHGGTSWGTWAGANVQQPPDTRAAGAAGAAGAGASAGAAVWGGEESFLPLAPSYDYSAPIAEDGPPPRPRSASHLQVFVTDAKTRFFPGEGQKWSKSERAPLQKGPILPLPLAPERAR
jgi:hypothetical protein